MVGEDTDKDNDKDKDNNRDKDKYRKKDKDKDGGQVSSRAASNGGSTPFPVGGTFQIWMVGEDTDKDNDKDKDNDRDKDKNRNKDKNKDGGQVSSRAASNGGFTPFAIGETFQI